MGRMSNFTNRLATDQNLQRSMLQLSALFASRGAAEGPNTSTGRLGSSLLGFAQSALQGMAVNSAGRGLMPQGNVAQLPVVPGRPLQPLPVSAPVNGGGPVVPGRPGLPAGTGGGPLVPAASSLANLSPLGQATTLAGQLQFDPALAPGQQPAQAAGIQPQATAQAQGPGGMAFWGMNPQQATDTQQIIIQRREQTRQSMESEKDRGQDIKLLNMQLKNARDIEKLRAQTDIVSTGLRTQSSADVANISGQYGIAQAREYAQGYKGSEFQATPYGVMNRTTGKVAPFTQETAAQVFDEKEMNIIRQIAEGYMMDSDMSGPEAFDAAAQSYLKNRQINPTAGSDAAQGEWVPGKNPETGQPGWIMVLPDGRRRFRAK